MTVLLGTASCGEEQSDPETPAAPDNSGGLEPAMTVDPGPPPVVDLLDAGEGEQRVLAYAPSREPTMVAVTSSGTARTAVPDAQPRVDDTPEQTLTVAGESEPGVDGAQRAVVTVEEFTSVDEHRAAQFATAPGFTITWVRGADGVVSQLSLEAPSDATDAARAGVEITAGAISDATVVFPSEPIGVGARWAVTRDLRDAVAPRRVSTYELTGLDADVAPVRMETSAPDVSDTLTAPAQDGGPGITLDVDTYEVTGSGELTVDLRAPLPVGGTTESSTRAVYVDPGTGRRTTYDEDSVLRFRSVSGDTAPAE